MITKCFLKVVTFLAGSILAMSVNVLPKFRASRINLHKRCFRLEPTLHWKGISLSQLRYAYIEEVTCQ